MAAGQGREAHQPVGKAEPAAESGTREVTTPHTPRSMPSSADRSRLRQGPCRPRAPQLRVHCKTSGPYPASSPPRDPRCPRTRTHSHRQVVRTALVDAASVSSLITTSECVVVEAPEDKKPAAGYPPAPDMY